MYKYASNTLTILYITFVNLITFLSYFALKTFTFHH